MSNVRKNLNLIGLLFITIMSISTIFFYLEMRALGLLFLVAELPVLLLFIRYLKLQSSINLILDNKIFQLSIVKVYREGPDREEFLDTIVFSTFGLLICNKVYSWGNRKKGENRLEAVGIYKDFIKITFTEKNKKIQVKILYGFQDQDEMGRMSQRILKETGIKVEVEGGI